jgi:hypothetical protein
LRRQIGAARGAAGVSVTACGKKTGPVYATIIATAADGDGGGTTKSHQTETVARLNSPVTLRDIFFSREKPKISGRVKPATIFA